MRNRIFIDFEASSLTKDSWPVEIGFAWIDEKGKLRSDAKLIKPHPSWSLSEWSEKSQQIHGITLEELEGAEDAVEVARWAMREFGNAMLLSDAAPFDDRWLRRLMALIGQDEYFEIVSIQDEVREYFEGAAVGMFFKAYANGHGNHRAGVDAMRLAQAWRAALRKEAKAK